MTANSPAIRVVAISLASAQERRARLRQQLGSLAVPWSIFDASTAAPPGLPYVESRARARRGRALKPAEIGCFASHYACLGALAEQPGQGYLVVIEDDVYLDPGFAFESLPGLMATCGIDYLRLHATFPKACRDLGHVEEHRKLVRYLRPTFGGTAAYAISSEGARRFLASISEIVRPIDDELDRFWHNGLVPYALFPFPALHLSGPSITPKQELGWRSYPLPAKAAYVLYRLQERLRIELCNLRLRGRDGRVSRQLARLRRERSA